MRTVTMESTGLLPLLAIAGFVVAGLSCGGDSGDPTGPSGPTLNPPPDDESGVVVTEPILLEDAALSAIGARRIYQAELYSNAAEEVSYVSFPPGSQPEADSAEVFNRTRDLVVGAPMTGGGLDPIAIPASIGDTLVITTFRKGIIFELTAREVPERKPPIIVRSDPPRGKTRVPLNSVIVIVFSEPLDGGTVTPSSVRLLRGTEIVPVSIGLAEGGLSLELAPEEDLVPGITHTIALETEVADRVGDGLEQPYASTFTTVGSTLNDEIAFESNRTGDNEIWLVRSDGTDEFQVTHALEQAGGVATAPTLSPDGTMIAFSVFGGVAQGNGEDFEIYVVNVDGSGLRNVTQNSAFDGWRPTWSPDGQRIAFFSDRTGDEEIWVVNLDGSNPVNLTDTPGSDAHPAWSPDGTRIAFVSARDGGSQIWVMNPDGTEQQQVTAVPSGADWPAWSADGTRIAFDSFEAGERQIWWILSDGTDLQQLTDWDSGASTAAFHRDGTRVAFSSDRDGSLDIWSMNIDGTNPQNLTGGSCCDFFPSWSP